MPILLSGSLSRNETVVADEPMHAIPRHFAAPGLFGEQAVETFGTRSAGQADRGAVLAADAIDEPPRRRFGQSRSICDHDDFGLRSWRS